MPEESAKSIPEDIDRVVMVSRQADGSPDQTENFEVIGEDETQAAATAEDETSESGS